MRKNFINVKELEDKINFAFFTSVGGVSKKEYRSLNCSKNNKDLKNNVKKNINIAKNKLKIRDKKLKLINQLHSNKILNVNIKNFKQEMYGDGLLTENKNIALGVLTADCAPIFIFDTTKNIICCLHSGWKGTLNNIVKNAVKKITNKKVNKNNIIAVIGPCLGYKNYEVDKKFKTKFIKKNKLYKNFFLSKNKLKDLFNLRELINFQLKSEGISKIYNIRKDTYKNSHIFFSHRKATHKNSGKTGRMINIISFKD